jgi:chromosome segregation ATPase
MSSTTHEKIKKLRLVVADLSAENERLQSAFVKMRRALTGDIHGTEDLVEVAERLRAKDEVADKLWREQNDARIAAEAEVERLRGVLASWKSPNERITELLGEVGRWKQEHQFQAELTKQLLPYQDRAVKAEKELARVQGLYDQCIILIRHERQETEKAKVEAEKLQKELGECSGGFETACKEADALKKTAAVLANNCADLRAALRTIRDATHKNAVTLRGMADLALKE